MQDVVAVFGLYVFEGGGGHYSSHGKDVDGAKVMLFCQLVCQKDNVQV